MPVTVKATDRSGNTASKALDYTVGAARDGLAFGAASHQLTYRTASSVYSQDAKIEAEHDYLGNAFSRDMLQMGGASAWSTALAIMQRHLAKGRTHELTLGNWAGRLTYDFALAKQRLVQAAPCISGMAGINEPDDSNNGGVNFSLTEYAAYQKKIWDMAKSTPALASIPVSCGAIRGENTTWEATNARFIDACRPYMDQFNWHWYPLAGAANATMAQVADEFHEKMAFIRQHWDGPVYISECGATTANVSLAKQADVCSTLVQLAAAGGVKCCIYELACDQGTGVQENFGVFNYDGTPRPAADALRTLAA